MNKNEKLKMLQSFDEKKLTTKFLIPLYESKGMACKNVQFTHKHLEFGKDLIYYKNDEYERRVYTAVQVKKTKIATSDVDGIFRQMSEAFGEKFNDSIDNKKKDIDKFVLVTSNEILEDAKQSLSASLRGSNRDRDVTYIDGHQLVTLLEKHLPSVFWNEYDCFDKYFNAMKNDFEKIKDISAIGQKEPIPMENLYVSLKVSQKLKDHEIYIEKEGKIFEEKLIKREAQWRAKREAGIDAEKAVKEFDKLVIVGAPGAGKTTLLKYIALKTCKQNLEKQERTCVPIPIILREFLARRTNLRDYIDEVFDKYEFPKAKKFIERELHEGRCRLLLDGFDELASKENQEYIVKEIHEFAKKYQRCQILVTSRIAGYHDELKSFSKLELMEFNDKQLENFIYNWFGVTNAKKATLMFNALKKNEQIKALARNPLMIATIAIIYEEDKALPQNRAALYERCVAVLLSKWDVHKKLKNVYSADKKEFILRKLAFYGHSNNKRVLTEKEIICEMLKHFPQIQLIENDAKPLLDEIWQRSYLLRQIAMNSYDFLHLSFQEYFTALELKEREDGISDILRHLSEPWWEEPILLYAGIKKDASALIRKIKDEVTEDIFYSNHLLCGKCIADAEFTEPALKEEIINSLWHIYQTAAFIALKERVINVLSRTKPTNIINLLVNDLDNKIYAVRRNAAQALRSMGNDKSVVPLIKVLTTDKLKNIRELAASALGEAGSEKAIEALIKALATDKSYDVRWRAATVLGETGNEKAIEALLKALTTDKSNDVRESAAWALENIGSKRSTDTLIKILTTNKSKNIRELAASALGEAGSEQAIEALIKALATDKSYDVRISTAYALGETGSERALEALIGALTNDKSKKVRESATSALGETGNKKAIEALIETLNTDKANAVRESAASALGEAGSEKAIEALIKALATDKSYDVRLSAASALGEKGNEKAIEVLIEAFTTSKPKDLKWKAVFALGETGNEKAIKVLIEALTTNKSKNVRNIAVYALRETGNEKAIEPLIESLITDKSNDVRESAASALGKIGNEKAIEPLIDALATSKSKNLRWNAAYALGNIGNEKAIEPLKHALVDDGIYLGDRVKEIAFLALEKISRRIQKRIALEPTT